MSACADNRPQTSAQVVDWPTPGEGGPREVVRQRAGGDA